MIILASQSPRRRQLLKQLGLSFRVVSSDIDEQLNPRYRPRKQVEVLSLDKAMAVAKRYKDSIVIAADTMVALGNEAIGKPKDTDDAKRILRKLSGTSHAVVTGLTIVDTKTKKSVTKSVETKVWFKKLTDREIMSYIKKEKPFDRAGAYGAEELGAVFVEKIEGDYAGMIGLPLNLLSRELKKFGVKVL